MEPFSTLVEEKLKLYDMELRPELLREALEVCEANWPRELRPMMTQIPDFEAVGESIREGLRIPR